MRNDLERAINVAVEWQKVAEKSQDNVERLFVIVEQLRTAIKAKDEIIKTYEDLYTNLRRDG